MPPLTSKKPEVHGFFRILVRHTFDQVAYLYFDSQLLGEFAMEALFKGLVRFPLAAWKLPQSAEVRLGMPLGDQQFAFTKNQASRDVYGCHA